jgi:iron complex outermembrane receptor protein
MLSWNMSKKKQHAISARDSILRQGEDAFIIHDDCPLLALSLGGRLACQCMMMAEVILRRYLASEILRSLMKKRKREKGIAGFGVYRPLKNDGAWMQRRYYFTMIMAMFVTVPFWPQQRRIDLTESSIEDGMNINMTSVSKKQETLDSAAAAIFVITSDAIRRSGASNIPDLLRMVPGLSVAQINGSTCAISSRGFNNHIANKLLVPIENRIVYSPLFNGVYWDAQEVPMEEIERIEVIRGPGAVIWGANAVNGVINIITKKASATQRFVVTGGGGTHATEFGAAQYGAALGPETTFRVDANSFNNSHLPNLVGQNSEDGWDAHRVGFRVDNNFGTKDSLTVQGDGYIGREGEVVASVTSVLLPQPQVSNLRQEFSGWDVLSRWDFVISSTSETTLQVYFDRTDRSDPTYGECRDTVDMNFQNYIGWGRRQDFVWGLGCRDTSDSISGSFRVMFNPSAETQLLFTSFVQDELSIISNSLYVTLGDRLEHNHFTGFDVQPSASIAWLPNGKTILWASVSKAVGTPSRETEVRFNDTALAGPGGIPVLESIFGTDQKNDNVLATEFGYRTQILEHLSLDLTGFYDSYANIISSDVGTIYLETDPSPAHLVLPVFLGNQLYGEGYGAEMAVSWKPISRWALSPGFSYLQLPIFDLPTSTDIASVPSIEGASPRAQAQLRSHVELRSRWALDTSAYFVGRLPALQVPSYTRLDTSLTWDAAEGLSVSVVGQNLLKDHHLEYDSSSQFVLSSLVKRSIYAKFIYRF